MTEQRSLPGGGIWNASWPIQIIAAAVLAALGVFMLLDAGRAELFAGLVFGGFLLVDGIRWAVTRIGTQQFGRIGEIESLRAGIGLLTAVLLFGLSFLDAITLSGVRLILAIGGIAFGLLGFVMVVLGMGTGIRWALALISLVVTAYGVLLLYTQFIDETGFGTILTIVAGIALLGAAVLAVRAILGARSGAKPAPLA
ncbi:MAG: hypothetical protein EPO00_09430 [Chloroflexota bacterium]|nr:MAG: hypothetical protein EPO00_09430 [Chloroflexota bacterium]